MATKHSSNAEKDDLNRELSATIDLPSGDDLQRITLSMTTDSTAVASSNSSAKKKTSVFKIVGIMAVILIGSFALFVLFMRRKNGKQYDTDNSVEIDSSPQHVLPDTPPAPLPPASHQPTTLKRAAPQPIQTQDPVYTPVQNQTVQRYTSLPELVGRYGTQEAASSTPSQKPTPTLTQAPHQNMNVVQQPQHFSLVGDFYFTGQYSHHWIQVSGSQAHKIIASRPDHTLRFICQTILYRNFLIGYSNSKLTTIITFQIKVKHGCQPFNSRRGNF